MSLKNQLGVIADTAIEEAALITALSVKEQLLEAAQMGKKEFDVDITNENIQIMSSETFLNLLSLLLDGVEVNFIEKVVFSIFSTKYLRFTW